MNIPPITVVILGAGVVFTLLLLAFALSGPSTGKAQSRRLEKLKSRNPDGTSPLVNVEAQMRKITANRGTKVDSFFQQLIPRPALLQKRLSMTGKGWTLGKYVMVSLGIFVGIAAIAWFKLGNPLLALLAGSAIALFGPHMVVGMVIKKRIARFNAKFPDAIELMVRGLRSGLPISETMGVIASEVPDPVGTEFRGVNDRVRIGKTLDASLEDAADRIGTPEFQFFCITLSIQRETGGNLAETLSNLAEVLRKRAQMKLKIAAMSSESKASAYIIGSLPFIVFGLIFYIAPDYMGKFLVDERLMIAGMGGMVWMSIGAFIMSQMINFEI